MPSPEQLLNDAIAALPKSTRVRKPGERVGSWQIALPLEVVDAINHAAAARGMSATAYMRRAITSFAAYDTGVDFFALSEHERAITPPGVASHGVKMRGRGHGSWLITGLAHG